MTQPDRQLKCSLCGTLWNGAEQIHLCGVTPGSSNLPADYPVADRPASPPTHDAQRGAEGPTFPAYTYYDGPREVQRNNYAAAVCEVLAKWVTVPVASILLRQTARALRHHAEESLEDSWPK